MAKVLSGAGLRGQVAARTALSTVGVSGSGITYRGYDVKDLAATSEFEEVAHLILAGALPNQAAHQLACDAVKKFWRAHTPNICRSIWNPDASCSIHAGSENGDAVDQMPHPRHPCAMRHWNVRQWD